MIPAPGNSVADIHEEKVTCPHCSGSGVMGSATIAKFLEEQPFDNGYIRPIIEVFKTGECPCLSCAGEGEIVRTV